MSRQHTRRNRSRRIDHRWGTYPLVTQVCDFIWLDFFVGRFGTGVMGASMYLRRVQQREGLYAAKKLGIY